MVLMRKHQHLGTTTLITIVILFLFYSLSSSLSSPSKLDEPTPISKKNINEVKITSDDIDRRVLQLSKPSKAKSTNYMDENDLPFMPKMENATLKAELGQAAWKLFHTILARYPDEPTKLQKEHLDTYITSFAQVYPCGDCARHFVKLLDKYPPQLSSRKAAALWGCHIHNQVNFKLKHDEYDCTTILEDYDCGCGSDEEADDFTLGGKSMNEVNEAKDHLRSIKIESKESRVGG